jgi:hypothetical protein
MQTISKHYLEKMLMLYQATIPKSLITGEYSKRWEADRLTLSFAKPSA